MDKALVQQASKSLELLDILLIEQSLTLNRDSYVLSRFKAEDFEQQSFARSSAAVAEYHAENNRTITTVIVDVMFGLRLTEEGEPEEDKSRDAKELVKILATFRAEYFVTNELPSAEAIAEFSEHNAIHNAFPFWRELVFALARKARLPRIFVPLYRFGEQMEIVEAPHCSGLWDLVQRQKEHVNSKKGSKTKKGKKRKGRSTSTSNN